MASAVLASRNEQPCWGERRVSMKKFTNSTPNNPHHLPRFNPNPSLNSNPGSNQTAERQIHDVPIKNYARKCEDSAVRQGPALATSSKELILPNRKGVVFNDYKESAFCQYVTLNLAEYSRKELKELKRRLRSELHKVRGFRDRIEVHELQYTASQTSVSYAGSREVSRPDHALDFPSGSGAVVSRERWPPKSNQQHRSSDFGGKKRKQISGQKRALPFSASDRDPKRAMVVDPKIEKLVNSMMKRCAQILTKLMRHRHGWVFNEPVDAEKLGLHDYHQIISHPMDLGTVKSRLDKNEYVSPIDFASDVRLTFNNAMTYNLKGQDVHTMAQTLLSLFEQMFNPAYQKYEAEHGRVVTVEEGNRRAWASPPAPIAAPRVLPEPIMIAKESDSVVSQTALSNPVPVQLQASPPAPPPAAAPSKKPKETPRSIAKLPKPKAKDPNKRPMSFEEKAKLSINLQNLPPEKMDQLVQILKKRNSQIAQDDDEIELDIEVLDNETLWELDRFVGYHKKAVSKMRRQGLIDNAILSAQISKSPIRELTPELAVQKVKKGDAGEEDVDIGEEIPVSNFPPVEIEKDAAGASSRSTSSSSSSSSSDSSSSSGSDSASSSGSDSDDVDVSVRSPCVESKDAAVT